VKAIQYLQQSLINYPFPAIAAIQGAAIGLGLDLATLCDIRLAGQNAYFSANTVRLGKVYHDTQARRLIRIVGWGAATEMLLTGHTINAIQAEKIGLATRLYPNDLLDEKAFELAAEIIEEAVSEAVRDTKFMLRSLAQNGDRP
jgi:enoyl-CoA hydratase/carnithine racemase